MENLTPADKAYFDIIDAILKYGEDHQDRTGVGTKRLFGHLVRFDLMESFPIITCKPAAFKNTLRELIFFLNGDPHIDKLKELGGSAYKWWEPFIKEDNTIGPIYPIQWRNLQVDLSTRQAIPVLKKNYLPKTIIKNQITLLTSVDGIIYQSNECGEFIIFNTYKDDKYSRYLNDIQFIKTGFIKKGVPTYVINTKKVYDPFYPKVCGKGFKTDIALKTELDNNIYTIWSDMLSRCYNPNCKAYKNYGEKNVFVCEEWFNFSIFYNDIKSLPGWFLKRKDIHEYVLDKDYYGSNCYSKETCVWLSKEDNAKYSIRNKPFKAINKLTKEVYIDISQKEFGLKHSIDYTRINDCLKTNINNNKKYDFYYLDYDENKYVYRYPLPIDQINNIINLIKIDPRSRRIC